MNITLFCQRKVEEFTHWHYPKDQTLTSSQNLGKGVLSFISCLFGSISDIADGCDICYREFTSNKTAKFSTRNPETPRSLDRIFSLPYSFFLRAIDPEVARCKETLLPVMEKAIFPYLTLFCDCIEKLFASKNLFTQCIVGRIALLLLAIVQLFSIVVDVLIGLVLSQLSFFWLGSFSALNDQAYAHLSATWRIKGLIIAIGSCVNGKFPS